MDAPVMALRVVAPPGGVNWDRKPREPPSVAGSSIRRDPTRYVPTVLSSYPAPTSPGARHVIWVQRTDFKTQRTQEHSPRQPRPRGMGWMVHPSSWVAS